MVDIVMCEPTLDRLYKKTQGWNIAPAWAVCRTIDSNGCAKWWSTTPVMDTAAGHFKEPEYDERGNHCKVVCTPSGRCQDMELLEDYIWWNTLQYRPREHTDGCRCQGCGVKYRGDLLVSDIIWSQISPSSKEGAGLLCPTCICNAVVDKRLSSALLGVDVDTGNDAIGLMMALTHFQKTAVQWASECFDVEFVTSIDERCKRFFEEAVEKVQAHGMDKEFCHRMVDHVFSRPVGEPGQETGGVMISLSLLDAASNINVGVEALKEIQRVIANKDKIRIKQRSKLR